MCWSGTVYVWFWTILSKDASLQCSAAFETQHTLKYECSKEASGSIGVLADVTD